MTEENITLTADQFDQLLKQTQNPNKIIRGAKAIAIEISRSETYVRKSLVKAENSPIKRDHDGSLYVFLSDLHDHFNK